MNKILNSRLSSFINKHKDLLFLTAILICMSLILYRNYVFGGKLFLFEDFGSDTVRVSLPTYIYFFDWLRNGLPLWSDKMGIGTSVLSHSEIIFDPFTYILFIFGKNGIVFMFVYIVVIKIILSGIFFWMFLGKYKLSSYAKIIGAITYAFGGYMIVMGQNHVFGTIYVYLPLILLGFEIWLQDKKTWLLILMLTLTALYFYYFFYMTAIFLGIYAIFRYFTIYDFGFKQFCIYISSLAWYGLLSMGLSAFFWIPSLALTLNNLRIGSSVPAFGHMILPDLKIVVTSLARLFGYDILGGPMSYLGYYNDYFQLALFSGILTIVLIPQIFNEEKKRKKFIYGVFLLVLLALLFIPFFPYMFNGFSDFTYRWTYILHFSLALFLAIAIHNVDIKKKFSYKILYVTMGLFLAIFAVVLLYIQANGDEPSLLRAINIFFEDYIFITIYALLMILLFRTRYKTVIKIIVLALVCFELVWFPRHFISDRLTTDPDSVKKQLGYFDSTNKVVNYLNGIDSDIYRIDKSYDSVVSEYGRTPSDNEAMAQGYRGLKSYNSNNQPNYIHFLQYAGIFVKYPSYVPPKGAAPQDLGNQQLNYINGVGDRFLLKTFLGVKYYLVKNNVEVPDYYEHVRKIDDITVYKNNNYLPLGFTFDSYITNDEFTRLDNSGKDIALLSFVVIDNPNDLSGKISKNNTAILNDIKARTDVRKIINEKRSNSLQIISYKDDNIVGKINVSGNRILVLTIPYDNGWTVYVDRNKTPLFKVDNGLIGVKLSPGQHIIELKYFPPMMMFGIFISIITLFLYTLFMRFNKNVSKEISQINKQLNLFYNKNLSKAFNKLTKRIVNLLKHIIQSQLNFKKLIFYVTMLFGILLFFLNGLITRGQSFYNLFSPSIGNYFMDFFHPLSELFDGPYAHGSIYPPLPLMLFKLMLRFIPYDVAAQGGFAIRATQAGQIVFLLYMLLTLAILLFLFIEIKKGSRIEKYIFSFIILFSAPFLFQFERGNIIFVALLFLMVFVFFKNHKNPIVREIALVSLSLSVGIKIYPVIFGLLLIKEKRFKEALRASVYCAALFFLPFFAVGGITQIPQLFKNFFSTSNDAIGWGVGYSVNIQSIIRIIFGYIGVFSKEPIYIGNIISIAILMLGIIATFFLRSKWKTVALLSLLMVMIPPISYEYTLIYMVIPLILFLDRKEKEKLIGYVYLACFILIFIPITLGPIEVLNNGFGRNIRLLTYGVLIQNISLSIMIILLLIEGLRRDTSSHK
ncbi:YfhO family protein [Patescibacteria group bacterium]|nr:YfhO family protein [Patescibacteria group bacterium]